MESIIDYAPYIFIGLLVGFLLTLRIMYIRDKHKLKKNDDTNIEWYGPDIYLKDKVYGEQEVSDIVEVIDNVIYKNKEIQRKANVKRSNERNCGANKINATRLGGNDSKDENQRT